MRSSATSAPIAERLRRGEVYKVFDKLLRVGGTKVSSSARIRRLLDPSQLACRLALFVIPRRRSNFIQAITCTIGRPFTSTNRQSSLLTDHFVTIKRRNKMRAGERARGEARGVEEASGRAKREAGRRGLYRWQGIRFFGSGRKRREKERERGRGSRPRTDERTNEQPLTDRQWSRQRARPTDRPHFLFLRAPSGKKRLKRNGVGLPALTFTWEF